MSRATPQLDGARPQRRVEFITWRFWIEPPGVVLRRDDHRHAAVDFGHPDGIVIKLGRPGREEAREMTRLSCG